MAYRAQGDKSVARASVAARRAVASIFKTWRFERLGDLNDLAISKRQHEKGPTAFAAPLWRDAFIALRTVRHSPLSKPASGVPVTLACA